MRLLHPLLQEVLMQDPQTAQKRAFMQVRVVARGGVEPPTFRFSVPSPPDRSTTTRHFVCRSYLGEAPEAPRALELLDSSLDSRLTSAGA